jgi:hypothetical protein
LARKFLLFAFCHMTNADWCGIVIFTQQRFNNSIVRRYFVINTQTIGVLNMIYHNFIGRNRNCHLCYFLLETVKVSTTKFLLVKSVLHLDQCINNYTAAIKQFDCLEVLYHYETHNNYNYDLSQFYWQKIIAWYKGDVNLWIQR